MALGWFVLTLDRLCISLMCYRVIKERINLVYLFTPRGNLLLRWVSGLFLARLSWAVLPLSGSWSV